MSLEDIKIMWAPQKLGVLKGVTFKYVTQYLGEATVPVLALMQNVFIQPTFIEYLLCTKHGLGMGDDEGGSRMGFRRRATGSRLEARAREGPTSRMQPGKAS